MRLVRTAAVWLLVLGIFVHPAEAVDYPSVVTAEVDFTEGDREKSRAEGLEKALRTAVEKALREEIGAAALRDSEVLVRTRFLNQYKDFISRSGIVRDRDEGFRLYVTVGYELDEAALQNRIRATRLGQSDSRKTVVLIWSLETPDRASSADHDSFYERAAWFDEVTAPSVVDDLRAMLIENGFQPRPYNATHRAWSREALKGREVNKAFLLELGRRTSADQVLYVRLVRRELAPPRAAHFSVSRINHVAFVVETQKGEAVGEPIAAPQIEYGPRRSESKTTAMDLWLSQIVERLSGTENDGLQIVFRSVPNPAALDKLWSDMRRQADLSAVLPYEISSERVVFMTSARQTPAELEVLMRGVFPTAVITQSEVGVLIDLPLR